MKKFVVLVVVRIYHTTIWCLIQFAHLMKLYKLYLPRLCELHKQDFVAVMCARFIAPASCSGG